MGAWCSWSMHFPQVSPTVTILFWIPKLQIQRILIVDTR